jgi:signal transduction histidine kinase
VARHAHASKVDVSLWLDSAGLQLVLKDDGHGYDITHPTAGFGLMGVRERVRNQSGDLTVESGPTGTLVRVRMKSITVL